MSRSVEVILQVLFEIFLTWPLLMEFEANGLQFNSSVRSFDLK
jgi:hypothetical protein